MADLTEQGGPVWVSRAPVVFTSLVGRRRECDAVRALVCRRAVRLVTLTGPGGVGKSRLATQVVTELDTGFEAVAFVALAPVRDPRLVEAAIADGLGLEFADGDVAQVVRTFLTACGPALVCLDNVEHLVEAGPVLAGLLADCPGLTLLVTSRARLGIAAEHVVGVAPLSLPPADAGAQTGDAVRLFAERARAVVPDFTVDDGNVADVVAICRRLDGLPLAIELAAARVAVLPPAALLARLERRLPVLTNGPRELPERLRTMRAGIAWSYDLLSADEQALLRRLGVFAGACTLTAAAAVAGVPGADVLDLVTGLVDKSLVRTVADEPRCAMLETIREFAVEQLVARGEEDAARDAHAAFFLGLAERAGAGLRGPEQRRWRDALEAELDDLRVALAWTLRDTAEDAESGLRLVGALWYFWFQRGLTDEGRRWLGRALDRCPAEGRGRAEALLGAGSLAWRQGDCATARAHLEEAMPLWRELGDEKGYAETVHVLGHVRFDQRDYRAAHRLFTDSLHGYRLAGDELGALPLVGDLGLVSYHEGDYDTAAVVWRESLALYREHGLTDRVAGALNGLGDLARLAGDLDRAAALYEESLSLWRSLHGMPGVASALHKLGQVSRAAADAGTARARFAESLAAQQELGNQQGVAECLAALAGLAADAGSPAHAVTLFAAANRLLDTIGVPLAPADQELLTRDLATTRARLDTATWQTAWAAGAAMALEDAVTLAAAELPRSAPVSRLTHREREVCALIAQGMTNRQIARALSISEKTVSSHVEHIMNKLDLRNRTRIALWATANDLGPSE